MTVSPFRTTLLDDRKSLYDLYVASQHTARVKAKAQVVSVSLALPAVDSLAVLAQLQRPDQLHFYWEWRSQRTAIAASEPVLQFQVDGCDRFTKAQHFIDATLADTIFAGPIDRPLAGPHFFCSFTFFDDTPADRKLFPAATVFLPRWHIACVQDQAVLVVNTLINIDTDLTQLTDQVWHQWQHLHTPSEAGPFPFSGPTIDRPPSLIQHTTPFTTAVTRILDDIEARKLQKLVLAHTLDVHTPRPLHLIQALATLRDRYSHCYVFSVGNGQGQTFIGASPERIIARRGQEFITEALAGSAPRGQSVAEDVELGRQLLTNPKDTHEHQVVLDYIKQRLWQLGAPSDLSMPPQLLQLPNIQHLRTSVTAPVPEHIHLLDVLAALHPTPAVAGVPSPITQQQIRNHEPFERHLYAAPLGWVDHQGNGEFTVGIRSALINGCCTRLYAGAGIVAGSDPERELAEIQLKLHTLLDTLIL